MLLSVYGIYTINDLALKLIIGVLWWKCSRGLIKQNQCTRSVVFNRKLTQEEKLVQLEIEICIY